MKKVTSLILALLMCLSLCACGSEKSNNVYLGVPVTAGDYEFVVTGVEFVSNWNPNGDHSSYCSPGNVHYVLHYTVKNIGKEELSALRNFTLNYADGFAFESANTYFYSFDTNSYVANASELPVLSKAKPCQTYFEVPEEVRDNTEQPLKVLFTVCKKEFVFNVRPLDEFQQEAYYNKAAELIENADNVKDYRNAASLLEDLGEYENAAELKETALLNYYALTYGSVSARDFFADRLEKFPVLSGEEIKDQFVGKWDYSGITGAIVINEDGTIKDQWGGNRTCKVVDNHWSFKSGTEIRNYEVRYVLEGTYLLVLDGVPSATMIKL